VLSSCVHKEAANVPSRDPIARFGKTAEAELNRVAVVVDRQVHTTILQCLGRPETPGIAHRLIKTRGIPEFKRAI
jgi:hypothetical protein